MIRFIRTVIFSIALAGMGWTVSSAAKTLQPAPAVPQPSAASLTPGLAVDYVYAEALSLGEAGSWRKYSNKHKKGKPLTGFLYPNTNAGDPVLTSTADEFVIAFIKGFMHFDQAGDHEFRFFSNDGLRVVLGGVRIYQHDFRHPCETKGSVTVRIPEAGWYEVETLFFQRLNTACLELDIKQPGVEKWTLTTPGMYAHIPE